MEVTQPRHIAPGNTYLITRRCSERRFFLRPDPVTTHLFLYALAEAATRFGIRVNAWLPMSNHYHAVVEDPEGVLPAFLCHFHKMVARSINTRWERRENFWSPDPASVVRLVQPADVLDKTVYALVNPSAAHLVERLCDWPGASSFDCLDGTVLNLERPRTFYREDGTMPEVVQLRAEAPTGWPGGPEAWATAVRAGVEARVRAITEKRRATGGRVVGRKKLISLDHNSKPSEAEPPRGLRPEIACLDPDRLVVELSALACFRAAYAEARAIFLGGVRTLFPWGTYKFVQELGLPRQPRPAPA